jgi:ABC-2 type transport system ATP-binding protein
MFFYNTRIFPAAHADGGIPARNLIKAAKGENTIMITLQNINKTFRVAKRKAGFGRALKALFSREYEIIHALNDVSFTIKDGEMVGYIGPNGAGKSTTIKIMCGILTPDSGVCDIDGRTPWRERVAHVREIGVVFGQRSQLWWDVPVIDSFELIRDIYKVNEKTFKDNLDELTGLLELGELLKTPTRTLSLGQRMRCEIAASLLHSPKILFLDEPTIGLDAVSKIAVRQFIKKQNAERGTTVILTTHDMQDIEALTERILLIGKGRILLDGGLGELKKHSSESKSLVIEYNGEAPALCEGMTYVEAKEGRLVIALDPAVLSVSDAIARLASQTEITDVSVSGVTAEQMVAALYQEYKI